MNLMISFRLKKKNYVLFSFNSPLPGEDLRASTHVGLVTSFWSDNDGEMWLHAHWLERAPETVLEEAGDPRELFLVDDCEDQLVSDIVRKVFDSV